MSDLVRLGLDAKIYSNSGNYASPTWVEITNVKDVTLTIEKALSDVTVRGNDGWRAHVPTLKEATIEFDMVAKPGDASLNTIQTAFFTDASLDVAVMDTDITTVGAQGLRAEVQVANFSRSEPLEEGIMYSVQLKPTLGDNAPSWMVVSGS